MSKIQKVTIEYNDHTREIEGKEAEKWQKANKVLCDIAQNHFGEFITRTDKQNLFDAINWKIVEKHPHR